FQKIAYLVDSSRGKVIKHDFLEYSFFAMFFPQLLAGPITHHSEIFSQTKGPWAFAIKPSNFFVGLTIFVIGLFKKVVLADHFALYVPAGFDTAAAGETVDFYLAWQSALAFRLRLYFNLLATMAISGLWHGAAWHFVLWGSLQGAAMVGNHAWRLAWQPINSWWSRTIARLVTFFGLTLVLVFYRAPSTDAALKMLGGMVNLPVTWHDRLGFVGEALAWVGVRFDSEPISLEQFTMVPWL